MMKSVFGLFFLSTLISFSAAARTCPYKVSYRCVVEPVSKHGRNPGNHNLPRYSGIGSDCRDARNAMGRACKRATDKCQKSHKYCWILKTHQIRL